MNFDTLIKLIQQTGSDTDSSGNAVYTETSTTVFAEKRSVRQTEFYQAATLGFKPEICLEVYSFEYHNEQLCELDGERFRIYRAFAVKGTDRTELYLTAIAGDTNVFA